MGSLHDTTFVVTDVETTGRSAEHNRITEVGGVWVSGGEIVDERSTLVNPEQYIPHAIQEMTGITNAMVLSAPKGDAMFPEIRRWYTQETIFTAHNATFDFNFLQHSFSRYGLNGLSSPKLCTLRLARRLLPARRGFSLGKLARYLGIRVRNRHRALGDAFATAKILLTLLEIAENDFHCESVEELLRLQYRPTSAFRERPKRLQRMEPIVKELPPTPGIYRMVGRGDEVLYVGKAKNLRERVGSYFRTSTDHTRKIREMVGRVKKVDVEETGSELKALLMESRLIKELQPKYNTAQKRLRRYGFLRLDLSETFPRVTYASEISDDGAEYYGPFRNRDSVEMLIETVNHLFKLRECKGALYPEEGTVPCFYHQIRRCDAPCALMQTTEEYGQEVDRVRSALSGSEEGIIGLIQERMYRMSERMEFEEAAILRDRITELRRVFVWKRRVAESVNGNNLLAILPGTGPEQREMFFIRFGRLAKHIVVEKNHPIEQLLPSINAVFFDGRTNPPQFDRIEVDEIRIIAGYLRRRRDEGERIYITSTMNPENVAEEVKTILAR